MASDAMFKLPWQRRAEIQESHAENAGRRLEEVQRDWAYIAHVNAELHHHQVVNGWTGIANVLFGARKRKGDRPGDS